MEMTVGMSAPPMAITMRNPNRRANPAMTGNAQALDGFRVR